MGAALEFIAGRGLDIGTPVITYDRREVVTWQSQRRDVLNEKKINKRPPLTGDTVDANFRIPRTRVYQNARRRRRLVMRSINCMWSTPLRLRCH